ncbi:hypothetical protein RF11_01750 [Thelohanellus kitauei]|uniref:Uncharacterized protein n=1 Tax=Thelohanellus kitauei TaxID=669202 RepID=A0A0C2I770_THEKT|nr:hypothetical protein RF11_01750 [Thelohanellus kitauei]
MLETLDEKNEMLRLEEEKANGVWKIELDVWGVVNNPNIAAVVASYFVSIRIARDIKSHTVADELHLPTAKNIVRVLIEEEYVNKCNGMYISLEKTQKEEVEVVCSQYFIDIIVRSQKMAMNMEND